MGVAIFNFLIECVSGKACMLSNEKCKSLFWTCAMYCYTESWSHYHRSTRKGCQHVLMVLYIGSTWPQKMSTSRGDSLSNKDTGYVLTCGACYLFQCKNKISSQFKVKKCIAITTYTLLKRNVPFKNSLIFPDDPGSGSVTLGNAQLFKCSRE